MKSPLLKSTILVVSALFAFIGGASVRADALFSETFNNTSGSSQSVNSASWSIYRGSTAVDIGTAVGVNSGSTDGQAGIASGGGNPSTPTGGYLYISNGTAVQSQLYSVVKPFASSLALSPADTISWTMGNSDVNAYVQVMIQLGGDGSVGSGNWYASTTKFYNRNSTTYTGSTFTSAAPEDVTFSLSLSTTAANWRSISLNPGTSMSIGGTLGSNLSSLNITGIGFYAAPGYLQQSVRLDTLTIVPEPQAVALLVMGAAVFFLRRKPKMTWA